MKYPYEYQPAPWGGAARRRPAGVESNRERSPALSSAVYPAPRERERGAAPGAALKYMRLDGPMADVTLGDTFAEVYRFSGRPDVIWVGVRAFPAMFRFTDRLSRETSVLQVPVDQVIELHLSRDVVEARNCIPASNAVVTVTGGWAQRDEPGGND